MHDRTREEGGRRGERGRKGLGPLTDVGVPEELRSVHSPMTVLKTDKITSTQWHTDSDRHKTPKSEFVCFIA